MTYSNDNTIARPLIQILSASCAAFGDPDPRCAWLHGFCLLTIQPDGDHVVFHGELQIGDRFCNDRPMISALADTLDPNAVLAGLDLTDMISRLGRLPIDATDQGPALALLGKLGQMLENQRPIDLTLNDDDALMVAVKMVAHGLAGCGLDDDEADSPRIGLFGTIDQANPSRLALELADSAGACALAIGEQYLEAPIRGPLLEDWRRWRQRVRRDVLASDPELPAD